MNETTISAGETFTREVVVYSDAGHTEPYDITGGGADFDVYDAPGGTLVLSGQAAITDAPNGVIVIGLSSEDTKDMGIRVLWYVVTLREQDSTTTNVDSGRLVIVPATSAL